MANELTQLERICWALKRNGASPEQIAHRLGISEDRAVYEICGAAAVLIRRWKAGLPRPVLRRVLRRN